MTPLSKPETSDRAVLTAMFDRAGVVWQNVDEDIVRVEKGFGPKNEGYSGFSADFHFTEDGSLDKVGIWE